MDTFLQKQKKAHRTFLLPSNHFLSDCYTFLFIYNFFFFLNTTFRGIFEPCEPRTIINNPSAARVARRTWKNKLNYPRILNPASWCSVDTTPCNRARRASPSASASCCWRTWRTWSRPTCPCSPRRRRRTCPRCRGPCPTSPRTADTPPGSRWGRCSRTSGAGRRAGRRKLPGSSCWKIDRERDVYRGHSRSA